MFQFCYTDSGASESAHAVGREFPLWPDTRTEIYHGILWCEFSFFSAMSLMSNYCINVLMIVFAECSVSGAARYDRSVGAS